MKIDGASRWRWGALTLAAWYAVAVLVPVVLLPSGPGDGGPARPCATPMECGPFVPDAGQALRVVVPFLLVSLLLAVPLLMLFLRRRWPQPLAGSAAALLAWPACLAGACVLVLAVRLLR